MKKYLLFAIALLTSIVSFAQSNYPKVTGLGNDVFIITVNEANQIKDLNFNLEETQVIDGVETTVKPYEALQTATEIRIVTEGCQLKAGDMERLCGKKNNPSDFTSLTTLNLENAELEKIDETGDKNPLIKFRNSESWSNITSVVFPSQAGMVIPSQCFGTNGNSQIQSIVIPDNKGAYTISNNAFKGLTALTSVTIGSGVTSLHDEAFANCTNLNKVDIHPGLETIYNGVFNGCSELDKIVLPEGLKTIGTEAFKQCAFTSIRLPNTLEEIGSLAFDQCNNFTEVVIPASVQSIGNQAFDECSGLRDVYVLGSNTKCVQEGFNNLQTNTSYQYRGDANSNGKVDIEDFYRTSNGSNYYPAVLHYPDGNDTKFLNPVLIYAKQYVEATTAEAKQDILDNIETDFSNLVETSDEYLINQMKAFVKNEYDGYYIVDNGIIYPKNAGSFFTAPAIIRHESNTTAGWKQFMFANATPEEKKWPETRMVDDKWYSMCLPFPMTATQIGNAFGNTTEVCKFSGVGVTTDGTKKLITLKFKERVTETQAHVPYMIHPGIKAAANGTGVITNTIVGVQLADGFDRESVDEDPTLKGHLMDILSSNNIQTVINADGISYTFRGNYFAGVKLPAYTYYWWPGDATWAASFYKTMTADQVNWTPYTSVVLCDADNGAADAKMVYFIETEDELFEVDEEEMGIATEIVQPFSVTKRDPSFDGKVMNMNGQVVSDSVNGMNGLPKGIYIVNGKKYVVR